MAEKEILSYEKDYTFAYCPECEKNVEVAWEEGCDETGETYDSPICPNCLSSILRCYECKNFIIDNVFTPLRETSGNCKIKGRIHSEHFICQSFIESKEVKAQ